MKKLRQLTAIAALTLTLSICAVGGTIDTPPGTIETPPGTIETPPAPRPQSATATGTIETPPSVQQDRVVFDGTAVVALDLVQLLLSVF